MPIALQQRLEKKELKFHRARRYQRERVLEYEKKSYHSSMPHTQHILYLNIDSSLIYYKSFDIPN